MATTDISTGINLNNGINYYKRIPMKYSSTTFNMHNLNTEHIDYPDMLNGDFTYSINGDNMIANFREGVVEIAYKKLVTDEQGLPMIVDNERLIQAIIDRLVANASRVLWYSGKIPEAI